MAAASAISRSRCSGAMAWPASASACGRSAPISSATPRAVSACARRFASARCRRGERTMSARLPERANPARVRVLLADDHAVVREGYRRLLELEPGVVVVGECADGESVRAAVGNGTAVDVLVVGL